MEEIHLAENVPSANETMVDSRNKFYSDQDSVTFSSTMATLTTLHLPPQPSLSLRVNLIETSTVNIPLCFKINFQMKSLNNFRPVRLL